MAKFGILRVLHVYKTFYPDSYGGIERSLLELCRGLEVEGVRSEIFTLSNTAKQFERLVYEGIVIHRVPADFTIASTPFSWSALFQFRRLVRRFDVVQLHFPWPFGDLLYWFSGSKVPLVVTYHSDIVRQKSILKLYRPLQSFLFSQARFLVATSPKYVESSRLLRRYPSKVISIPLGLDQAFYPVPDTQQVCDYKSKWGRFFSFVGVFRYYKGLRYLIEGASKVSAPIVLMGDGPEMAQLRRFAVEVQATNVLFLGAVSDFAGPLWARAGLSAET